MTDKQEIVSTYNMNDNPKDLQKKVTLLHHFKNYLEGDSNTSEQQTQPSTNQEENENKEDKDKEKDKEKKDKPFTMLKNG